MLAASFGLELSPARIFRTKPMTDLLILFRNIVLAAILAWIGVEFAPSTPENAPDSKPESSSALSAFR